MIIARIKSSFEESMKEGRASLVFRIPGRSVETSADYDPEDVILTSWEKERFEMVEHGPNSLAKLPEETSREEYDFAFNEYKRVFENSELNKAILSAVIRKKKPVGFDPMEFFIRLTVEYPNAFTYLLLHPKAGLWCGATPELLISGENSTYQTVSLAGTQPKSETHDYKWNEKELEEQELVSEHIRKVLTGVEASNISESPTQTIEAGQVAHLKTDFSFNYTHTVEGLL
ncbi:MAG: chorismate-binding protein, partial [Bacteroidota bacterium]